MSRKDIQILVGFGCPSPDKKVVFSAKLLRKLVHLDEGDVSTFLLVTIVDRCHGIMEMSLTLKTLYFASNLLNISRLQLFVSGNFFFIIFLYSNMTFSLGNNKLPYCSLFPLQLIIFSAAC